jgi:hypothetical protein
MIYTSSVSKFTPKNRTEIQQLPGQLKVLKIIPVDSGSKVLSAERESIILGVNKNDQIFFRISSNNNWIMLPGLLNRVIALHQADSNVETLKVLGLNKSNDMYTAVFDIKGNMVKNWTQIFKGEDFSDIVDINGSINTGAIMQDKAGNMFVFK